MKSLDYGLKYSIRTIIKFINKNRKKGLFFVLTLFLHELKPILIKILIKKDENYYFIIGKDGVNWSIDKDNKHLRYIFKINNYKMGNIFTCTHVYCVRDDLLLKRQYLWLLFFKKLLKFKIISTVTNDIRPYKWKINKLKDKIDIWVAPSTKIFKFLEKQGFQVVLIPFYVSHEEFYFIDKKKEDLCNDLNLDYSKINNKIIIGSFQRDSISSLDKPKWQKNPDLLIKILNKLPKNDYILLLAGPRRHYIINQCEKFNIPYLYYGNLSYIKQKKDDIFINNHSPRVINLLYNLSDLYIISSKIEGGPKAILEASLTKTLIISTDVGLTKDFIHEELIYSDVNIKKVIDFILNLKKNQKKNKSYIEFNYNQVLKVLNKENYRNLYNQFLLHS